MHCGNRDLYEKLQYSTTSAMSLGILNLSLSLSYLFMSMKLYFKMHLYPVESIYSKIYCVHLLVLLHVFFFFLCDIFGVEAIPFQGIYVPLKKMCITVWLKYIYVTRLHMFITQSHPLY